MNLHSFIIQVLNGIWLLLVLVGVPSLTSRTIGSWQVSSRPHWEQLTLWGLGLGLAANLALGWMGVMGREARRLWLRWAWAYAAILAAQALVFAGYIHFRWLQSLFRWLERQTRRWG